jgi:hypothetical protein
LRGVETPKSGIRKEESRVTDCTEQGVLFSIGRREVTAAFDGGWVTSEAGVLLLSQLDSREGLTATMSEALIDTRQPGKVRHSVEDLLRQRIYQICCGYEDVTDANALRFDPGLQTALRRIAGSPEATLASQPTLSRLEEGIEPVELSALSDWLLEQYIGWLKRKGRKGWRRIVLDMDSTDDPTHGAQQMTMFHGFYDQWMYHPLLVFDSRGFPAAVLLRPGNAHDSWESVAVLTRVIHRLRRAFPKAEIILRADGGFASPALYEFLEAEKVPYVIGLVTNPRLVKNAEPLMKKARSLHAESGEKVRLFGQLRYRAESWTRSRRVIVKAEVMRLGDNPRFVLTTLPGDSGDLYPFYTERGQSENWIKDLKNAVFADRLSCHAFDSNQFRLFLHTAAYLLLFRLREQLDGTALATSQMDTLRLKLLKIGARVQVSARRIWFHLASGHPSAGIWLHLARRLADPAALA